MENLDKLPPQALEMETNVLGAMLIDREAAGVAVEILRPEDFYRGAHRRIFEVARDLYDREQTLDQALLRQALADRGQLEEVGGVAYLAELTAAVATSAHVEQYARHVRDRSLARQLIAAATEIVREGFEPGRNALDLLEAAEQRIYSLGQDRAGSVQAISDIIEDLFHKLQAHHGTNALTGIPTGFLDLDEKTSGLQPGELIIVAGRPSTGKTSLALNILNNVAAPPERNGQGTPVALFSLEMTREQVAQNLACLNAEVDSHKLRRGRLSHEEWSKLETQGRGWLRETPIFIDDCPEPKIVQLRAKARRLKQQKGITLAVFDYLQLIQGPAEAASESRQQEVAAVSRSLKALARELRIPVIALCQLNRGLEDRPKHRPQLSDLRESGAIEQDADVVLLLHRPGLYQDPPDRTMPLTLLIAKNRNGPVADVELVFDDSCFRFRNAARRLPEGL
jgi:replicative DNA helicase